MSLYGAFWRNRFDRLETLLNRMDQSEPAATRSIIIEREMPHPPDPGAGDCRFEAARLAEYG